MTIKRCERCDLNYVKEGQKYCNVCKKLLEGKKTNLEKAELCPSCGKRLVKKGHELCGKCHLDMLDTIEKLEDENGDVIDQNIIPADIEVSEINIVVEDEEENVPDDIKQELDEEVYD